MNIVLHNYLLLYIYYSYIHIYLVVYCDVISLICLIFTKPFITINHTYTYINQHYCYGIICYIDNYRVFLLFVDLFLIFK